MALTKLLISIMFLTIVQSKDLQRFRRQNSGLCDVMGYTDTNKVQCYCKSTIAHTTSLVYIADCMVADNIAPNDDVWKQFAFINTVKRLSFSSKGDNVISYVPTLAFKSIPDLLIASIAHGNIEKIHSYAFGNLTKLQELKLSGNGIRSLEQYAFANHPNLTSIQMDNNQIVEIERNVFNNLPQLQELFLINNNITTIHDRAFVHLGGLKVLELDKNYIFVLTNETFLGLSNLTRLELSGNNIEVIGDNTFSAVRNLRSLFLSNNKIKMLDDKAFQGITKLESLSLAHNNLKELSNPKIFSGLNSLLVLDLKANSLKELPYEIVAPIVHNFYSTGSSLGFEDNEFSCDCKLSWFMSLKNHTKNHHLKEKLNNLMCYPSTKLQNEYKLIVEMEKSNTEDDNAGKDDYDDEYYDEKSMGGKLFFSDIPARIIPCPAGFQAIPVHVPTMHSTRIPSYTTTYKAPSTMFATESPNTPELNPKQQTRTASDFENKITNYPTDIHAIENIESSTEDKITHSFDLAQSNSPEIPITDNDDTFSTSSTVRNSKYNGMINQDIMQGDSQTIPQVDKTEPKSMSHVHISKGSCLHFTILSVVMPICRIWASLRFNI